MVISLDCQLHMVNAVGCNVKVSGKREFHIMNPSYTAWTTN